MTEGKLITADPFIIPNDWEVIIRCPGASADPFDDLHTLGVKRREGLITQYGVGAWTTIPLTFLQRTCHNPSAQQECLKQAAMALTTFAVQMGDNPAQPDETKWEDVQTRIREMSASASNTYNCTYNWSSPYVDKHWNYCYDWDITTNVSPSIGKAEDLLKICSTMEETEMEPTREKQIYKIYRMVCLDNVNREVLCEGHVAARSEASANLKFAEIANKADIGFDIDLIGDRYDFYIIATFDLFEPEADLKVTKVKVVE